MKDEMHNMSRLTEMIAQWQNDRDDIKRILAQTEKTFEHLTDGQNRIFTILGNIDGKLSEHSEKIVRATDAAVSANEKIDKHKEDHWKNAALNVSILGVFITLWKWMTNAK